MKRTANLLLALSICMGLVLTSVKVNAQTARLLATYNEIRNSSIYNSYQIAAERVAVDIVNQLQKIEQRKKQVESWNKTKKELGNKVTVFYVGYGFQIIRGSGAISKDDLRTCANNKQDYTPFENAACDYLLKQTRDSLGYIDLGNLERNARF